MWIPDLVTLVMVLILVDLITAGIMFLYRRSHRTYDGYTSWMASLPVMAASYLLMQLRGYAPDLVAVVLANTLLLLAYLLRCDGLWRFLRTKGPDLRIYLGFLAATVLFIGFFTLAYDSIAARVLFRSIVFPAILILSIVPLVAPAVPEDRGIRRAFAAIACSVLALYLLRFIAWFLSPVTPAMASADAFECLFYTFLIVVEIVSMVLFILLNMSRFERELQASCEQLAASEEEIRGQYELLAESEKRIRESEGKYRAVIALASDGIHVIQDGVFRFVNPRSAELHGATPGEMIGKPFLDYVHPRERERVGTSYQARMSGNPVPQVYETTLLKKNEEAVEIEVNAVITTYDGRPADLVVLRDISERKRSQKALENAKKKLNMLNYVTFNDIRNQVFSLQGFQHLGKTALGKGEVPAPLLIEREEECLQNISDSLRLASAYQDLGMKPAKWQNVTRVFLLAISHLDFRKMERTIETTGLEIFADPLLEQVFQILGENTLAHGGTATRVSLRYVLEADETLTLIYEDNGQGIPDEDKERIFFQESQKRRSLGLFIAREILETTEISIRESGTYGAGARFEIRVPKGMFRFTG